MDANVENDEREFWDEHVPTLEDCMAEYHRGPDANTAAMLDAVEPLSGKLALDFACGAGVTSAWLAARGATVLGIDLSPRSIDRAAELSRELGLSATFIAGTIGEISTETCFDRIVGRYALHHVEVGIVAPLLASKLAKEGTAAFLETMATNRVLRIARGRLVGQLGIPRCGTLDEHPLTAADLKVIETAFGQLDLVVGRVRFLTMFDRQVLRYRSKAASRFLTSADEFLRKRGCENWSYHQVLRLGRAPAQGA